MRPEIPRCGDCPVAAGECYARRSRTARICELPAMRGLIAGWGAEGGPGEEPILPHVALVMVGWPACVHRSHRGCCGDTTATCSLGHGQAGIVDEPDCRSCYDRATDPPTERSERGERAEESGRRVSRGDQY